MPKPATIRQARYDAAHTSRVGLKLHNDLDADILARLAWAKDREGMQGKGAGTETGDPRTRGYQHYHESLRPRDGGDQAPPDGRGGGHALKNRVFSDPCFQKA